MKQKKVIVLILSSIAVLLVKSERYNIKKGYTSRSSYHHFDDTKCTDEFQNEVYQMAKVLSIKQGYTRILDIGCGSGYKLIKYFDSSDTVGSEIEPTLSFLKKKYPHRKWMLSDFSKRFDKPVDLVICSDVIEHLIDPNQLLDWISKVRCKKIILSTPDRYELERRRGKVDSGPPRNKAHIREWGFDEFERYVSRWFNIEDHLDMTNQKKCQLIICSKRNAL